MVPYTATYVKFPNEKKYTHTYKFQHRDRIKTRELLHKKNWLRKLKHIK